MSLAETILASLTTTGIVGGLFIWLFKESIQTSLKLDLETRLNTQKADLDRVRDNFQFQIQQAMLSIQKTTEKTHEVYPELYEKLHIAQSAVGRLLGLRESPTWEEYSLTDLESMMARRGVVSGQIQRLSDQIAANRPSGIIEMDKYLRIIEFEEVKGKFRDLKNYVVLKDLYITQEISEESFNVTKFLWGAIVDAASERVQWDSYQKNIAEADKLIASIKLKMRAELTYKTVEAPTA